jgi:Protein of unknown function (DUF2829)
MNFEEALSNIKKGARMTRQGWNGKSQFVYLVNGSQFNVNREPLLGIYPEGTKINYHPHIDIKTVSSPESICCGVWFPTMGDLLAEDWHFVVS